MKTSPHVDGRDPFHQLQLIWYISYCFTSFCTSQGGARCCLWKTTPRRNFPRRFFNPIDPDFRIPPVVRWGGILASYWPKRKRISGSILVHNWGDFGLGPGFAIYKKYGKSMVWMVWFYRFRRGIWHWSKLQMFGIGNTEELYHVSDILCQ